MRSSAVVLISLAVCLWLIPASAAEQISRLWRLSAGAEIVAAGSLSVPVDEIRADVAARRGTYVDLAISVDALLKGNFSRSDVIKHFIGDAPYNVSNENLIALNGQRAILFLVRGPNGLYFPNVGPEALQPASASLVAELQKEIARQETVSRNWRPRPDSPHYREVEALVGRLVNSTTQDKAIEDLDMLAPDAVLAIIDLMDDRRSLGVPRMTLRNKFPNAFEGLAYYGPKTVVDVCVGILNRSARANFFGSLVNGGPESERKAAVAAWRVYADMARNHPAEIATPPR